MAETLQLAANVATLLFIPIMLWIIARQDRMSGEAHTRINAVARDLSAHKEEDARSYVVRNELPNLIAAAVQGGVQAALKNSRNDH